MSNALSQSLLNIIPFLLISSCNDSKLNLITGVVLVEVLKSLMLSFANTGLWPESQSATGTSVEVENMFSVPMHIIDEQTPGEFYKEMNALWAESAEKVLGEKKNIPPKPWITEKVEMIAEEKREAKCKGYISKFNKLKREIRKQIRADK